MPDIQPIHIGLLILIIFGAAAWYGFRKNADGDREAMKTAGKMNDKPTQEPAPVPNAVLNDEPEAPTLKADDQASDIKPVAEVEIKPIVVQPPVEDEPALNDDFEVDFAKMGRRNTDVDDASHGFLIGGSIPLFANKNKVKSAKARHAEAQMKQTEARIKAESATRALVDEMRQLRAAADAYDLPLMRQTLSLLRTAVDNGELSVTDYYSEADGVYRNMQTYLDIERQYQGVVADVMKNEL